MGGLKYLIVLLTAYENVSVHCAYYATPEILIIKLAMSKIPVTHQIEEIGKNGDDGTEKVEVGVSKIRRKRVDLVGQEGVDFIFGGL